MTQPWHPYVFDTEARRFVGRFEEMYRAEAEQGFDSWHQSDPRRLDTRVALLLADEVSWRSALDLGCGKGAFTAALKRRDNHVTGVDVSPTAIGIAEAQYPGIEWVCAPIADHLRAAAPVDLVVIREVLSYLEDWREVLARAAEVGRYVLVGLYLPPDPVGFVPSHDELRAELERHFDPIETVDLVERRLTTYLCASRSYDQA